jgi:hypothetical protein
MVADFRLISSQIHFSYLADAELFALDPGATGELALWGGGPKGEALEVRATVAGVAQIVFVAAPARGSDLRIVRIRGARIGSTSLEAYVPGGPVWASADLTVGFTPGRMAPTPSVPISGEIPAAIGAAAAVRIPVPGTNGLCIELSPRGWTPKAGSTSTLFVQDALGKRNLRLDYGYNVKTGTINYHWNQSGTYKVFGVADHTPVGAVGRIAHTSARYFRYAGRTLAVVAIAVDVYSVVTASKPLRQATKVVSGWAGAWIGCKVVGAGGAWVGTAATPGLGTAVGGIVGCAAGAFIGYEGASHAAGRIYDWADATFTRVPEAQAP